MNFPKTLKTRDESTQYDPVEARTRDEGIQCELLSDRKIQKCDQGTQYEPVIETEATFKRLNTFPSFKEARRPQIHRHEKSLSILKSQLEKECGELFLFETKQDELFEIKCKHPNRIKDRHLKELFKVFHTELILNDYSGFNSFYLDLEFCTELTGDAFKELAEESETRFLELQAFWLNLHGCTNITDDKIKYFAEYLAENHKNLETLTLDFRLCTKIGDNSMKEIGNVIAKNIRNLKKLYLSFSGCKQITNEGVEYLFSLIGTELTSLQVFSLKLNNCVEITDSAIDKLTQIVDNSSIRLAELSLELMGTQVEEDEKVLLIGAMQKHINKIYIL